jgi:hypothetical protein
MSGEVGRAREITDLEIGDFKEDRAREIGRGDLRLEIGDFKADQTGEEAIPRSGRSGVVWA